MKIIPKINLRNLSTLKQLKQEIQIMEKLTASCFVTYHKFFQDRDFVCIKMDMCEYGSLYKVVQKRKVLTELEAKYWLKQAAHAIRAMHSKMIIHRDITLRNMLIDRDMKLRLTGFGNSVKLRDAEERRRSIIGTPNYIAPEILDDDKYSGHSLKVDIWSLGICLYTMLFGAPPFQSYDVKATYSRIRLNDFTFPTNINVSK